MTVSSLFRLAVSTCVRVARRGFDSRSQKFRKKYFSGFHQNLDPVDRDPKSCRSISCGILLFPPPSAHVVGLSWSCRPVHSLMDCWSGMILSGRSTLRGVPRLLTTPGQTWWHTMSHLTPSARTQDCDEIRRNLYLWILAPGIEPRIPW